MNPAEAVFVLASSGESAASGFAVKTLCHAPPDERWNRGLFLGLRSDSPKIVAQTIDACVRRLENLPDDLSRDRFLGGLLDECFVNLSETPRFQANGSDGPSGRTERAAADLLNAVGVYLKKRPLELEHHRSRLLSRARRVLHMEGRGAVAGAIVDFQRVLAEDGGRSDNLVAESIRVRRKKEIYESSRSSDPTLLAYLEKDAALPLEKTSREIFSAYRILLAHQTKERAPGAILKAIENLAQWLDAATPQSDAENRGRFVEEAMRASALVPWEDLPLSTLRCLESHLELLPGPDHPEDLINILKNRYASREGEEFLVRGLELLGKMPMIRFRSDEICRFMTDPARLRRSEAAWDAFFDLIGKMLTGLPNFVSTGESLTPRERRRNRAMTELLARDGEIRKMLHRLSSDMNISLSNDRELDLRVREKAWRVLLRNLPEFRSDLFREGLMKGRLFFATIEEAGAACRREVWAIVEENWDNLFENGLSDCERRARIAAVTDFFKKVRCRDAVRSGAFTRLALDDPDPDIGSIAKAAVSDAGYDCELRLEMERRGLLALRDDLSASNEAVAEYENEADQIRLKLSEVQTLRVRHTLSIQEAMQSRDILATRGWISTSELHVRLEEVRVKLEKALESANQHSESMNGLRDRMNKKLEECRAIFDIATILESEKTQHEKARDRLDRERLKVERSLEDLGRKLAEVEAGMPRLRPEHSLMPSYLDNPEDARRAVGNNERALAGHGKKIADIEREMADSRLRIESCERGIATENNAVNKLRLAIELERERIRPLQDDLVTLRNDYEANKNIWKAARERIAALSAEVARLEKLFEEKRTVSLEDLERNTARIMRGHTAMDQTRQRLRSFSNELNAATEKVDNQITRSQELANAIDSGRRRYDTLSAEADKLSAEADARGLGLRAKFEQERREEQEFKIHYAWGLHRGLRNRKAPPTLDEQKKKRWSDTGRDSRFS